MNVTVTRVEGGLRVEITLTMNDETSSLSVSAAEVVPLNKVMDTITSDSEVRALCAKLIGRLLTPWKLNLIKSLCTVVPEAMAGSMVAGYAAPRAPED